MRLFRLLSAVVPAGFVLLACTGLAQAQDVQVGNLVIESPWSRATPGGAKVGVGYLAIVNIGNKSDRLTAATSPIAERVEIHSTRMDGGVMRMRKINDGLELKPQEVTEFKPGGLHLMFIGLKQPIKKGDKLPVRLTFAGAGQVDLTFVAAAIGARSGPKSPGLDAAAGSRSGVTGTSQPNGQGSSSGQTHKQ